MATRATGWGRIARGDVLLARPDNVEDLQALLAHCTERGLSIGLRGGACSPGDAIVNDGGVLVDLAHWDRIVAFDEVGGTVTAQGGARLAAILDRVVGDGWALGAIPGSPAVTVGGAIAGNVHGKDSFSHGPIGKAVVSMEFMTADGRIHTLSRTENAGLFEAVVGGLGLLGVVLTATLRLRPIAGGTIRAAIHPVRDLEELEAVFAEATSAVDYGFGWLDTFDRKNRGYVETARWTAEPGGAAYRAIDTRPHRLFGVLPYRPAYPVIRPVMGRLPMRVYNALKARAGDGGAGERPVDVGEFLYPQAFSVPQPAGLFPGGYLESQILVPDDGAFPCFRELLAMARDGGFESWLCSVKRLREDQFPLSFSGTGYTISYVVPGRCLTRPGFEPFFRRVVDMTRDRGGKIHLVKDQLLRRDDVEAMYPHLARFQEAKVQIDPGGLFSSDLYRRLLAAS